MIFAPEDIPMLNRLIIRKGCEVAAATFDAGLDEVRRRMKVEGLVHHINRARVISSVTENMVAPLDVQVRMFEEGGEVMTPSMHRDYMASLSKRESEDEAHFVWMMSEFESQLPYLKEALRIAEEGRWECSITDSDVVLVRRVRDIMSGLRGRLSGPKEMLRDADFYALVTTRVCSVLLRLSSAKPVTSEEISDVVMISEVVRPESFERLSHGLLGPSEAEALEAFRAEMPRYRSAMYARCVLNARQPRAADVRSSPIR